MTVIFLDFDGVMTTRKTRYDNFDPECTKRLQEILDKTGAKIVVSSTWRINKDLVFLKKLFEEWGINPDDVIGLTPRFSGKGRGTEITAWLDKNLVDNYIVIDDDSFDIPPHLERLVHTKTDIGLQDVDRDLAITKLGKI